MLVATDYTPIVEGIMMDREFVINAAQELADYAASSQTTSNEQKIKRILDAIH